jgi:hypothetical protein
VKQRTALIALLAALLAGLAVVHVWPAFQHRVVWTPDSLYYEAKLLEIRGESHDAAMKRVFRGPLSASLRARDPQKTGNPRWVKYNEPFYDRRVAVPLVGAAIEPVAGDRSLLDISLAGYVATIVALFALLLLRFRLAIAAAVTAATIFLPPLVNHSSFPLTDSWGLALEIVALTAALLTLDRGRRWLPLWIASILLLSFTRDSTWIPVLAAGCVALKYRTRLPVTLFATGVAAALPALLLFKTPVRDLLALLVNHSEPPADPTWSFIASHYPRAVWELVRANVGFLRRGEWYTAVYIVGGVLALLALVRRRAALGMAGTLLATAAVLGVLYVLAAPVFSAFRLELVVVPVAAYGLALVAEAVAARAAERSPAVDRLWNRAARYSTQG